jgi:hypothetical protein
VEHMVNMAVREKALTCKKRLHVVIAGLVLLGFGFGFGFRFGLGLSLGFGCGFGFGVWVCFLPSPQC